MGTFGYVVAESVACGTPAKVFNYMGPAEMAQFVNIVKVANNEKEFLAIVERTDEIVSSLKTMEVDSQKLVFSSKYSTDNLLKILYHYHKTLE